jgi:hypothetical protein
MGPGEQDLRGQQRADAGLIEQLRRKLPDEAVDFAGKLSLLERQVLYAASDSAKRKKGALEFRIASTGRAHRSEAVEQSRPSHIAELSPKRLRRGYKQRVELVQPSLLRDRRPFTGGHQRTLLRRRACAGVPRHCPGCGEE